MRARFTFFPLLLSLASSGLFGCGDSTPGVTLNTPVEEDEPASAAVDAGQLPASDADGGEPAAPLGPGTIIVPAEGNEPPAECGNASLADDEACDDGNTTSGDGCSDDCELEMGFICESPGTACEREEVCGDGRLYGDEACDDGNKTSGDGCTEACAIEANFACPEPGSPCVSTVRCGDGVVSGDETCDDGDTTANDGCSDGCTLEDGWQCAQPGARCTPICGDALVTGRELCDDGNALGGDGCSAACQEEAGFVCETPGMPCRASVCGDSVVEGGEPCDDGNNNDLGDGCSPGCQLEPDCSAGACVSSCGDGLILASDDEQCDDGNLRSGDGCSDTCQREEGFACKLKVDQTQGVLELPIIYRDFKGADLNDGHPDFEQFTSNQLVTGLVRTQLGRANTAGEFAGKPVFGGAGAHNNGSDAFGQWYRDTPGVNLTVSDTLRLTELADQPGAFRFTSNRFFPLDNRGFTEAGATAPEPLRENKWMGLDCAVGSPDETHNYHFTSEVRYWFEFKGGETLQFKGDDDVWMFINGRLVVDLGGVHQEMTGEVTLDANAQDVDGQPLGLEVGKVYEAVVFQAERHTCESNYQLTLTGFSRGSSECNAVCGDGIITPDEQCDDGPMNGSGYGFCTAECTLGPRCGDGEKNGEEFCDNGINLSIYQTQDDACAPGCKQPGFCGDGVVDASFAESCDDGDENDGRYDGCNADCTLGPRCGDGVRNGDEQCDDGNAIATDGCSPGCKVLRNVTK